MLEDFQHRNTHLNFIIKAFYSTINIVYLFLLKIFTKNKLMFSSPRLGKGLNITVSNEAVLDVNNLSSRKNLNIFVSQGALVFKKNCFVNNNCSFNCLEYIQVGENTIFGESVKIYDHDHLIDENYVVSKNDFVTSPVMIGANCWIGSNTVILKGVSIADNVIIGANSLVNKSILVSGIYVIKNGLLTKIK